MKECTLLLWKHSINNDVLYWCCVHYVQCCFSTCFFSRAVKGALVMCIGNVVVLLITLTIHVSYKCSIQNVGRKSLLTLKSRKLIHVEPHVWHGHLASDSKPCFPSAPYWDSSALKAQATKRPAAATLFWLHLAIHRIGARWPSYVPSQCRKSVSNRRGIGCVTSECYQQ